MAPFSTDDALRDAGLQTFEELYPELCPKLCSAVVNQGLNNLNHMSSQPWNDFFGRNDNLAVPGEHEGAASSVESTNQGDAGPWDLSNDPLNVSPIATHPSVTMYDGATAGPFETMGPPIDWEMDSHSMEDDHWPANQNFMTDDNPASQPMFVRLPEIENTATFSGPSNTPVSALPRIPSMTDDNPAIQPMFVRPAAIENTATFSGPSNTPVSAIANMPPSEVAAAMAPVPINPPRQRQNGRSTTNRRQAPRRRRTTPPVPSSDTPTPQGVTKRKGMQKNASSDGMSYVGALNKHKRFCDENLHKCKADCPFWLEFNDTWLKMNSKEHRVVDDHGEVRKVTGLWIHLFKDRPVRGKKGATVCAVGV